MRSMNRKQALLCALAFIIPALVGFFVWSDDGKRSGEDSVVADMESVNMAEPVEDAMRVYIPLNPERTTPAAAGLVNINHASGTELETLPGIGAKTADKIIEYRNEHGGFRSKEELKEVPTIGEGKYAKVSERITL